MSPPPAAHLRLVAPAGNVVAFPRPAARPNSDQRRGPPTVAIVDNHLPLRPGQVLELRPSRPDWLHFWTIIVLIAGSAGAVAALAYVALEALGY